MKLFRVRFTTKYGLSPFGEISEFLHSSKTLSLGLHFISGGWNMGESSICFHEWTGEGDRDIIQNFLETKYGKSLIDLKILDKSQPDTYDTPDREILE